MLTFQLLRTSKCSFMLTSVLKQFRLDNDFEKEPIGTGKDGKSVYSRDIWPSIEEIVQVETSTRKINL